LHEAAIVAHHGEAHDRTLPDVVVLHLRHRHVELLPQAILHPPEHHPLLLQRMATLQVEGEARDADGHLSLCFSVCLLRSRSRSRSPPALTGASSVAATVSISNASTMSPTFTSW